MEWIKVTDNLPDDSLDNEQVLVTLAFKLSDSEVICAHYLDNEFYNLETSDKLCQVTHWMPLPEPPKTENA